MEHRNLIKDVCLSTGYLILLELFCVSAGFMRNKSMEHQTLIKDVCLSTGYLILLELFCVSFLVFVYFCCSIFLAMIIWIVSID